MKISVFAVVQGLLLALIMRAAFENSFVVFFENLSLRQIIEQDFPNGPTILQISQITIFFVMLARFYAGAYQFNLLRSHELNSADENALSVIINLCGTFFVITCFYLIAIHILSLDYFYLFFFIMHVIDLVWFILVIIRIDDNSPLKILAKYFIIFSGATIVAFWLNYTFNENIYDRVWVYLAILTLATVIDLFKFWEFYFHPKDWYNRNSSPPTTASH